MPGKQTVTMKTIAIAAQVTPAVVSAILGRRPSSIRFSSTTADRVLTAARLLKYRPHRMAQSMRAREHHATALITWQIYRLPHLFLHWLALELGRHDHLLIIQNLHDDVDAAMLPIFRQRVVDAALCCEEPNAQVMDCIAETGLRTLFINADPPGRSPRVLFDEAQGMRQAVDHLSVRGYRRIVLHHSGSAQDYWTRERRVGVLAAAKSARLPPPEIIDHEPVSTADTAHREAIIRLAGILDAGTGLILQDGNLLQPVIQELERRGLRIPDDVGIIVLGTLSGTATIGTHLELNTRELAGIAARLLLQPAQLRPGLRIRVPYRLHSGWTTG